MEGDANEWELDGRLVEYLIGHINRYIPDKDIANVLEDTPVSSNIPLTLKMDTYIDSLLKEKGYLGTNTLAIDKSISRISNNTLAKIWQNIERARSGDEKEKLNLKDVATSFQQSILLLGQAINAANFFRRQNACTKQRLRTYRLRCFTHGEIRDNLHFSSKYTTQTFQTSEEK